MKSTLVSHFTLILIDMSLCSYLKTANGTFKSMNRSIIYAKSYIILLTVQQWNVFLCMCAVNNAHDWNNHISICTLLLQIKQCHQCCFFFTWISSGILWTKNISKWWRLRWRHSRWRVWCLIHFTDESCI